MFSTLIDHPDDITFEGQEDGEIVVLFLRQHLITLVPGITLFILSLLLPFVFFSLVTAFSVNIVDFLPTRYWIVISLFEILLGFGIFLERLLTWYNNVYILTNERVLDMDFHNVFTKNVSFCNLKNIEDVTYTNDGILRLFFDYGDVLTQTAGETQEFNFQKVSKPAFVSLQIQKEARLEDEEKPGEMK